METKELKQEVPARLNEAGRAALEKLILSSKEVQFFLQGAISQMEIKGTVAPRLVGIEFVEVKKAGQ